MAKIVKLLFLILFLFSTVLNAQDYMQELLAHDKQIATSNDDELLRVHHALKSIYIQSIINNDLELKKETLKRLVKTANILKLNATSYAKELSTLNKNTNSVVKKEKSKKKIIVKKKSIATPKKKINVVTTATKSSNYLPNLKSLSNRGDRLELVFDKKLTLKDIKSFQLKSKKIIEVLI